MVQEMKNIQSERIDNILVVTLDLHDEKSKQTDVDPLRWNSKPRFKRQKTMPLKPSLLFRAKKILLWPAPTSMS